MEQSKDLEIIDNNPLNVTHETLKIYSSLKQCMANNEELRQTLVDATDTIDKQSEYIVQLLGELNECRASKSN